MNRFSAWIVFLFGCAPGAPHAEPLGLPHLPVPRDNPQTAEKIELGKRLFHDPRFSRTGKLSCASCHEDGKAFTDSPRSTSEGVDGQVGPRNAPTVANAAYAKLQFWDGRSKSLEEQARQPFVNPTEMGLANLDAVVERVRADASYMTAFRRVFGKAGKQPAIGDIAKAIASYERSLIYGNSPFDRFYFKGQRDAMTPEAIRGMTVFLGHGHCATCHPVEKTHALFTDDRFHDIGIGPDDLPRLATTYAESKAPGADASRSVLSAREVSELGRYAVSSDTAVQNAGIAQCRSHRALYA
jgi:cytochrome c peroxidase